MIRTRLHTILRNAKQIDLVAIAQEEIQKFETPLVNERQLEMFNKGIDSDGNRLTPKYAESTKKKKKKKGLPTNRVTLFDSGAMYDSMFLKQTDKDSVTIDQKQEYAKFLKPKYGEAFLGISVKSFNKIKKPFRELIKSRILSKLLSQ